jgi:hypothetical protein
MKPQNLHAHEDRLLDFVYGELPPLEARAVESHVEGCARCSELLAGIRGVRTTMAQLPMEPAPEAGLESLLAYAQQAARNAAAGPAPKPTWWRRWLMPAMGVAAVTVFGVLSIQVNKSLNLKAEVAAQSVTKNTEEPPVTERAPEALPPAAQQKLAPQAQLAQVPASPPPQEYAQDEGEGASPEPAAGAAALPASTPPPSAPAAKLERSWLAKEAARKKPSLPGRKGSRSDWSNAGSAGGYGESKDADLGAEEELASADTSYKKAKTHESDRRDAMTQAGPFPKPKPILAGSAPEEPAQAAMPEPAPPAANQPAMNEPATGDGLLAEREAQVQQQAPSQGSLRIGGSKSRGTETASRGKAAEDSSDDFDDLFGSGKKPVAQREQRASSGPGASPPPPPTAAAAPMPSPMPSMSTSAPSAYRSMPSTRDEAKAEEKKGAVSTELLRQADAAMRSGNRGREAELLRQALAAGATGKERLGLLNRLCEAEFAIGNRQAAFEACSLVLEEDPRSSAAQVARNRLRREGLEDAKGKAGTGSRGPVKAAPVDKMEAPALAQ